MIFDKKLSRARELQLTSIVEKVLADKLHLYPMRWNTIEQEYNISADSADLVRSRTLEELDRIKRWEAKRSKVLDLAFVAIQRLDKKPTPVHWETVQTEHDLTEKEISKLKNRYSRLLQTRASIHVAHVRANAKNPHFYLMHYLTERNVKDDIKDQVLEQLHHDNLLCDLRLTLNDEPISTARKGRVERMLRFARARNIKTVAEIDKVCMLFSATLKNRIAFEREYLKCAQPQFKIVPVERKATPLSKYQREAWEAVQDKLHARAFSLAMVESVASNLKVLTQFGHDTDVLVAGINEQMLNLNMILNDIKKK